MRPREDLGKGSTSEGIVSDHDRARCGRKTYAFARSCVSPCSLFAPYVIRTFSFNNRHMNVKS